MDLDWILGAGHVQSLIVRDPLCEQGIQKAHTSLDMIFLKLYYIGGDNKQRSLFAVTDTHMAYIYILIEQK